ncbi:tRNA glutamyl-Q(34) synthetase GluQRS [Alphaproteobacteria bacterium]|nr:tRNA glutamyl-Q(34) synthetase GluQRS [Alphaproteobacteria bacterium]
MDRPVITRFAPSPTGPLHLGHAYAAKVAHDLASQSGGKMILRIDDIDHTRCRDIYTAQIFNDLDWLGLNWYGSAIDPQSGRNAPRQTQRMPAYQAALKTLQGKGLVYPCYLSRRELNELLSAPHAPLASQIDITIPAATPALVIANTDQLLSKREQVRRHAAGHGAAWRLRMDAAIDMALNGDDGETLSWFDHLAGWQIANPAQFGDMVIARADIAVSYHLSVVIDDALDGVTLVTRGNDLAASTHLHRLLQALFALSVPDYCHHALVLDQAGKRLAKRDSAHSLEMMRQIHDDPSSIFGKIPPIPAVNLHGNA